MEKLETRKGVRLAGVTVICILISFLGLWLARRFQLPFWLDTVGLCLAAYYTASLPMTLLTALATGMLTVAHMGLPLAFLLGNLVVAAVYAFIRVGYLNKLQTAMMSSFGAGVATVVIFTPAGDEVERRRHHEPLGRRPGGYAALLSGTGAAVRPGGRCSGGYSGEAAVLFAGSAADPAGAPDGTEFHYITEGKIANVTALLTDRQGRLWVGTNDQGVAVLENGQFRFLNRENGWSDNSVRTIFQAKSGDVYVGTLGELCRVSEDLDTITRLEKSITGVWSIAENTAALMACVDYSGQMFLLKNDRLLAKWEPDPELGRYACVLDDRGTLYAGSDGSGIYVVRDGKVIDILNEENGLSSRVILRMIPYR